MGCRYCCEGASIFYRFYRAVLYFVDAMFDDNTGTQSRHLICIDKVFKSSLMNYKMAKTTKGSGFSMFTLKRLAETGVAFHSGTFACEEDISYRTWFGRES